jgi:non-homologous end joining protein Ku
LLHEKCDLRFAHESDLVKGYEVAKGEYVVLDERELRSVAPKTSTEMEIVEFVPVQRDRSLPPGDLLLRCPGRRW